MALEVFTLPDNLFVTRTPDGAKLFQTATGKHNDPRETFAVNVGHDQVANLMLFLAGGMKAVNEHAPKEEAPAKVEEKTEKAKKTAPKKKGGVVAKIKAAVGKKK